MTLFLGSVRDAAEAAIAVANGVDIVDLKEPSHGALGAVAPDAARDIVREVRGRVPVSSTIGDIALEPLAQAAAIDIARGSGPDFIKIGLFDGDLKSCERVFRDVASTGQRLVAVVFADRHGAAGSGIGGISSLLEALAGAGFSGVMADTGSKSGGSLRKYWTGADCAAFVSSARLNNLFVGLAGSLSAADIPSLAALSPDILGFRGALCQDGRNGKIDAGAVASVCAAIPRNTATRILVCDRMRNERRAAN